MGSSLPAQRIRVSAEQLRSAYLAVCASLLAPSAALWLLSLSSCRTCSFEGISSYNPPVGKARSSSFSNSLIPPSLQRSDVKYNGNRKCTRVPLQCSSTVTLSLCLKYWNALTLALEPSSQRSERERKYLMCSSTSYTISQLPREPP